MRAISCQPARPRLPKVQYTTVATMTSSAKYCTRVVPPVNMELMATPARTMVEGVTPRTRERARISTVVAIPPKNAQAVTR